MGCIKGYLATEPGLAVCGNDGQWIIEYPECEGMYDDTTCCCLYNICFIFLISNYAFILHCVYLIYLAPVRLIDESGDGHAVYTDEVQFSSRGRVEVLMNGEWHTVCSQGFGFKEANVVCNQLGLNGARRVRTDYYGEGSGGIFALRNRGCDGGESNILNCDLQLVSITNPSCSHGQDVGVECLGEYV